MLFASLHSLGKSEPQSKLLTSQQPAPCYLPPISKFLHLVYKAKISIQKGSAHRILLGVTSRH